MHNDFMAIRHGVPGHDNGTAILRAQPARMIDGHVDGGYTGQYEVICPACGDDPNLSYQQVPRDLQQLRGPSESLASGLAAFHLHIGLVEASASNRGTDVIERALRAGRRRGHSRQRHDS